MRVVRIAMVPSNDSSTHSIEEAVCSQLALTLGGFKLVEANDILK
jgi:hypothetical protein